jgi:hypothetical protein
MIKKLLTSLIVLVLLLVVGLVVLVLNLERIARRAVEGVGTELLGVRTSLQEASVSLRRGEVVLSKLALDSPEGFDAPRMFELAELHVRVDLWSLTGQEMVVHEVVVKTPRLTMEMEEGRTNWAVVLAHLRGKLDTRKKRKVQIGRLSVENGQVALRGVPVVGEQSLPLPPIELKDIGTSGEPLSIPETLLRIVTVLASASTTILQQELPMEELGELKSSFEETLRKVDDLRKELKEPDETIQDLLKTIPLGPGDEDEPGGE